MTLLLQRFYTLQQTKPIVELQWSAFLNTSDKDITFMADSRRWTLPGEGDVTALLIFISITAALRLLIQHRKKWPKLPGPQPLPFIGNAHLLAGDTSRLLSKISNLLEEYNGLMAFWIGPKLHVFISEPDHLEAFCTNPKLQDKSEHYDFVRPTLGNSIFTSNGATWKQGRKLLMPSLRPMFLKNLLPNFNDHTRILVENISVECGKENFDAFPYIRNCAYAMIFETLLGRRLSSHVEPVKALEIGDDLMDLMYQRALKLWFQWDPLFYILPQGKRFRKNVSYIKKFNGQHLRLSMQKLASGEIKGGLEGQLLVEQLSKKMEEDEFDAMLDHLQTMLVTGYDTTAGTMCFTLMMLGMSQEVQQKAYEEVARVMKDLDGKELSCEDLNKFEYLERVIKETLRLFPVGPLLFRKASDDVQIGNVMVPRGATVACVMLRTHRDPRIFPNPLTFNPDNFLPDRMAGRHPYAYIPFSAGSRGCIGMKYGMMSMKVIISQLIYNYKIFCDTTIENIRLKPEITLKIESGYQIRIQKRESS